MVSLQGLKTGETYARSGNSFRRAKTGLLEKPTNSHCSALTRKYNGGENSFRLLD